MAKYDVYPALRGAGYLMDMQSDLFDSFETRVVVPMVPEASSPPIIQYLNPVLEVADERHVLLPQSIATVPSSILKMPAANLSGRSNEVTRALDMLFQGF